MKDDTTQPMPVVDDLQVLISQRVGAFVAAPDPDDPDGPYRGWGYCAKCQRLTPGIQHRHAGGMNFPVRLSEETQERS